MLSLKFTITLLIFVFNENHSVALLLLALSSQQYVGIIYTCVFFFFQFLSIWRVVQFCSSSTFREEFFSAGCWSVFFFCFFFFFIFQSQTHVFLMKMKGRRDSEMSFNKTFPLDSIPVKATGQTNLFENWNTSFNNFIFMDLNIKLEWHLNWYC